MVSTCILKLEEDGMLSIDDPIDLYLRPTLINDTINASSTITIKNLLNHTSGIANSAANNSCQLNILSNLTASHTLEEAVYCGSSQGELFSPGTDWTYSNTNYTLLAMIIQELTGMTYSDYISQTIFTPMGMTSTEIPTTDEINGDHMGCYWNIMGNWTDLTIIDATTYAGWADVVSNTHDLTLFMDSLLNWAIIGQVQLDKMKTIDPVATN
jgi:D-alanyl-D-alanine carboxypeptidase